MKSYFLVFLLGLMAGAGGFWYFNDGTGSDQLQYAREQIAEEAGKLKTAVQDTYNQWAPEVIKEELARTSVVIREKAVQAGQSVWDATANARTTTSIKTKFLAEPGVPGMSINVDSAQGVVTLSGTVNSHDEVARAIRIALDTEGVSKVISTLQVKPAR